jgi:hypothetical protein
MLAASAEEIGRRLGPGDVVLDIGGWADPFPRADWVMDAMPYATRGLYEREGWVEARDPESQRFDESRGIQRDICDRQPFPFADGELDFVICSQTLEDIRDPLWVCQEMQRIGQAGYIEVPSRLEEQSYGVHGDCVGWPHHRWLIDVSETGLDFVSKPHDLHARNECHFPAGFWEHLSDEERVQTVWWSGDLAVRERIFVDISPYDSYLPDFVRAELARRPAAVRRESRGLRARLRRGLAT